MPCSKPTSRTGSSGVTTTSDRHGEPTQHFGFTWLTESKLGSARVWAFSVGAALVLGVGSSDLLKGDDIDVAVNAQMRQHHIPGLALAVIQNGKIVREQGYGYRDEAHRLPITSTTLFQAGSVSKPVAALGALHLVEQGRLALDENVNEKLQSWHLPEDDFTKEHPVTLRLILSHSAGVTVHGFSPGYRVGAPLPSLVQILDGQAPANNQPVRVDQVPGAKWRYSGGGYLIMQQLAMDATGRDFDGYMQESVLRPLGMDASTFAQPLPKAWEERAATGYVGEPRRPLEGRWDVQPALAAGGLWTTVGDLARFYLGVQRALAGTSNPVVSQAMARQMVTAQHGNSGLGFMVGGTPLRFGHNGGESGFRAITVAFPTGEGVAILMNADADVDAVADALVGTVGEQYHWPGYSP